MELLSDQIDFERQKSEDFKIELATLQKQSAEIAELDGLLLPNFFYQQKILCVHFCLFCYFVFSIIIFNIFIKISRKQITRVLFKYSNRYI